MSRKEVYLVNDYIIPSLKTKRFGKLLEWEDEVNGIFRLFWYHKSRSDWNKNYFIVFTTWDALNGRNGEEKEFYTKSKGRFRSALRQLKSEVISLKKGNKKNYRRYQIKKYKVNNENTALKLKKIKQNCFSGINITSKQEFSNMLNSQIITKQDDYNSSSFSEAKKELRYLRRGEESQFTSSGSSDSSILNSENDNDNEYQRKAFDSRIENINEYQQEAFDSENIREISNLSDSSSDGIDCNSSYSYKHSIQLHDYIHNSEEEKIENKENTSTELQAMDIEELSTYDISDLDEYINGTDQLLHILEIDNLENISP